MFGFFITKKKMKKEMDALKEQNRELAKQLEKDEQQILNDEYLIIQLGWDLNNVRQEKEACDKKNKEIIAYYEELIAQEKRRNACAAEKDKIKASHKKEKSRSILNCAQSHLPEASIKEIMESYLESRGIDQY